MKLVEIIENLDILNIVMCIVLIIMTNNMVPIYAVFIIPWVMLFNATLSMISRRFNERENKNYS